MEKQGVGQLSELNTARGPIDTADLGVTLMHEHVFIMTTEIAQNYPEAWGDEEKRVVDAIARLNELKARGVDTIVDLTVIGLGRYIPRIARVAAATELNIVVATGLYTFNDVPICFHFVGPGAQLGGPEIMTDMFVRDIEQGIADTGIKAGILKCATDERGITPRSAHRFRRWPNSPPACGRPRAPAAGWAGAGQTWSAHRSATHSPTRLDSTGRHNDEQLQARSGTAHRKGHRPSWQSDGSGTAAVRGRAEARATAG
jgi:hypothetical protein